jgi:hypothetical protein
MIELRCFSTGRVSFNAIPFAGVLGWTVAHSPFNESGSALDRDLDKGYEKCVIY